MRSVGGAAVGQDAFDGHAAGGEPGDSPVQDCGRGDRGFVGVDFGVGDAGVVVDDGVDGCGAGAWVAVGAVGTPGGGAFVAGSLLPAEEPVSGRAG